MNPAPIPIPIPVPVPVGQPEPEPASAPIIKPQTSAEPHNPTVNSNKSTIRSGTTTTRIPAEIPPPTPAESSKTNTGPRGDTSKLELKVIPVVSHTVEDEPPTRMDEVLVDPSSPPLAEEEVQAQVVLEPRRDDDIPSSDTPTRQETNSTQNPLESSPSTPKQLPHQASSLMVKKPRKQPRKRMSDAEKAQLLAVADRYKDRGGMPPLKERTKLVDEMGFAPQTIYNWFRKQRMMQKAPQVKSKSPPPKSAHMYTSTYSYGDSYPLWHPRNTLRLALTLKQGEAGPDASDGPETTVEGELKSGRKRAKDGATKPGLVQVDDASSNMVQERSDTALMSALAVPPPDSVDPAGRFTQIVWCSPHESMRVSDFTTAVLSGAPIQDVVSAFSKAPEPRPEQDCRTELERDVVEAEAGAADVQQTQGFTTLRVDIGDALEGSRLDRLRLYSRLAEINKSLNL